MASVIDHALEEFAAEVGSVGPIAIQGGKTRWDIRGVPLLKQDYFQRQLE